LFRNLPKIDSSTLRSVAEVSNANKSVGGESNANESVSQSSKLKGAKEPKRFYNQLKTWSLGSEGKDGRK